MQETLYEAKARQVTSGQEGLETTLEIAMRQVGKQGEGGISV